MVRNMNKAEYLCWAAFQSVVLGMILFEYGLTTERSIVGGLIVFLLFDIVDKVKVALAR